jgi:hypothetical protein
MMGRWYAGKVSAYDGRSGKHTIQYKDGDVQRLLLRNEAVLFLDVPGLDGPGMAARLAAAACDGGERAPEAEQGSCSTGACSGRPGPFRSQAIVSLAPLVSHCLSWMLIHATGMISSTPVSA